MLGKLRFRTIDATNLSPQMLLCISSTVTTPPPAIYYQISAFCQGRSCLENQLWLKNEALGSALKRNALAKTWIQNSSNLLLTLLSPTWAPKETFNCIYLATTFKYCIWSNFCPFELCSGQKASATLYTTLTVSTWTFSCAQCQPFFQYSEIWLRKYLGGRRGSIG